jgi:hypothetical protein
VVGFVEREQARQVRADREETEARTRLIHEQADRVAIEVRHRRFDLFARVFSFATTVVVAILVLFGALPASAPVLAAGGGLPAGLLLLLSLLNPRRR